MFCNQIAVGFPPKAYALSAYLALLEEEAPGAPWMIADVGADIRPLIGETIAPWRSYSRRPRGCAAWHNNEQPRNG